MKTSKSVKQEGKMTIVEEAFDAVCELNGIIYDGFGEAEIRDDYEWRCIEAFNLISDGSNLVIDFLGIMVWCKDDDDREWHDGEEIGQEWQEPLIDYLRKEAKLVLETIRKIKL